MIEYLRRLFAHLAWADARVLESIREAGDPPHPRELFAHILGAELVWLARIEQRAPEVKVWPDFSLYQCGIHAGKVQQGYDHLLSSLDEAALERQTHYTNSANLDFDSSVADILLHVAMHGSYHRGQIAWLVREGGAVPCPTDYIGFARGAPAATRLHGAEQR